MQGPGRGGEGRGGGLWEKICRVPDNERKGNERKGKEERV